MIFNFETGIWIEEEHEDLIKELHRLMGQGMAVPHYLFYENKTVIEKYGSELDDYLRGHFSGYGGATKIHMMPSHNFGVNVEHEGKRQTYYFQRIANNKGLSVRVAYVKSIDTLFVREPK